MSYPPMTLTAWLRYDIVSPLLDSLDSVETVLEIGVGEGSMGTRLASRFRYLGLEQDAISWERAKRRLERFGGTVTCGDTSVLQKNMSFDLICVFEVLEHIEDDRGALRQWREHLAPGRSLILSVPAFRDRFGPWDERAGHYRRYEPDELSKLLYDAGYTEPRVWSYGYPLGNMLEWLRHSIARRQTTGDSLAERTAASGRALQPPAAFGWATWMASMPFRLIQRRFLDTRRGIGLVAHAWRAD